MNFKDPFWSTFFNTFAYNLISSHHDIIISLFKRIILSLVYWSLYKIVKEYSWNNFYKTEGILLTIVNKIVKYNKIKNLLNIKLNIIKRYIKWSKT